MFRAMGQRRGRLPLFQSVEGAECGLACLAMIGAYHGHDIDLNGLRQRFSISMSGASLRHLKQIAEEMSLTSRALKVDLLALHRVKTPAILHWNLDHFVVLKSVSRGRAVIHDPARGVRTISFDTLSAHFSGVVLELERGTEFVPFSARAPVRLADLWSAMRGRYMASAQIVLLSLVLQVMAFAAPFQLQLVIDHAIEQRDQGLLFILAAGFATLVVLQVSLEAVRSWVLYLFGSQFTFQTIGNVVRHLMRLPSDFFEKRHVGDILSRVAGVRAIKDTLAQGALSALLDGLMSIFALVALIGYSPKLTALVVLSVVLSASLNLLLFPRIRMAMETQLLEASREQTCLMETVRAATTIKIMGAELEREAHWRKLFVQAFNSAASVARQETALSSLQSITTGLQGVLILYLGALQVMSGQGFTLGMFIAFLALKQTFVDRSATLLRVVGQFRLLRMYIERLADIIAHPAEPFAAPRDPTVIHGGITARSVSFRYGSSDKWVFRDLDLSITPGEFVAITGPSGQGKTTLLKLLLGLQPPTTGEIMLGERSATPSVWRDWRAHVGVVLQDDRLMSGTLAENIAFFAQDLDMERVIAAARAAKVHDDIQLKPMQYRTLVGDMGSSLSGGQKQRLLLARALYRQPRILLLDEGTANLDEASEEAVATLVADLPITRIVVAHRPALVLRASRVLELRGGVLSDVTHLWRAHANTKPEVRPANVPASSIA
ncbi:peptidase domain-containing ABC transporter [Caulobacter vibrioides]|uniref:Peptidase domain-containing ABC transporter n=1 Tax=Caulobacter vibrioides TaxID=155892 RepID=A0A290MLZ6_CAUVI|nr:peptidase domain-containing ABC transporter [Caulobacter vibrioides]ATC33029.1 peptidase domain-containing ABC transporter [Caulobacter vibrioides]